jgi:hypothetical protein
MGGPERAVNRHLRTLDLPITIVVKTHKLTKHRMQAVQVHAPIDVLPKPSNPQSANVMLVRLLPRAFKPPSITPVHFDIMANNRDAYPLLLIRIRNKSF